MTMVKTPGLPARILLDAPVACDRHACDARGVAGIRGYRPDQIELRELPDAAGATDRVA
jgi:hypothetical protein